VLKKLVVLTCLMAVLALSGCVGSNTNPPDYIKQTTVLKEGDGLQIYIILADSSGQMTSSNGKFTMTISDNRGHLSSQSIDVKTSDFQTAKIGMGALQHDALILNIGRIPFSGMLHTPSGSVKVKVSFTPTGGKTLSDDASTYI
jgi:hypothetical protein